MASLKDHPALHWHTWLDTGELVLIWPRSFPTRQAAQQWALQGAGIHVMKCDTPCRFNFVINKRRRRASLVGKKLRKTGTRESTKPHAGSRRSKSYSLMHKSMTYEKAIEAGAHKVDIKLLIKLGHLEVV